MVSMGTLCTKFHLHVLNGVRGFEKWRGSHGENCLRLFIHVIVMETLQYTCVPSFVSIHFMVCKFEK